MDFTQDQGLSLGRELFWLEERVGPNLYVAIQKLKQIIREHVSGRVVLLSIDDIKDELEGMQVMIRRYHELKYRMYSREDIRDEFWRAKAEMRIEMQRNEGVIVRGIKPLV